MKWLEYRVCKGKVIAGKILVGWIYWWTIFERSIVKNERKIKYGCAEIEDQFMSLIKL